MENTLSQDEALLLVREQDMKKRISGGQEFIQFLASFNGSLAHWSNMDKIVDSLAMYWVSSSNFKVALLGLDILSLLVERLQKDFQSHYPLIQNALVDRLGDQKDQVRDASITLLTNIMDVAAPPQYIFEKLQSSFSHKVWRVREGLCRLLVATINRFGSKSLSLSKLLPHLCKLLSDTNGQVRENAMLTIVEIYRHVGDKVRQDLAKKGIPASRLHALYERFDVVLQSGDMVAASETASLTSSTGSFDSLESSSSLNRVSSSTSSHHAVDVPPRSSTSQPRKSMAVLKSSAPPSRSNAGAVDEDSFKKDYLQNLPSVHLYKPRDVDEQMSSVQQTLSDERKDWEERIKALKTLRAIVTAGGSDYDTFYHHLRLLEPALQLNAKDLRSQVVRETCVTIGFLASRVKQQFEHSACVLLPILFGLIPNAAKVMASSGILAIRTILKHTYGPRLIPIVTSYCTSRTTAIRRNTFAFITIMFHNWPTQILEKHVALLNETVHKGISDADSEAREEARKAWHGLHEHFPAEAGVIFDGLNPAQQKLIKGKLSASSKENVFSNNATKMRNSLSTSGTGPRRVVTRAPPSAGLRTPGTVNTNFLRSRSDIDPASVKRSQLKAARSGYGTIGRASKLVTRSSASSAQTRGREAQRPVISQPGSRSTSPTSQQQLRSLTYTPTSKMQAFQNDKSPQKDFDNVFDGGGVSTHTPPSSPTPARKSRIPVSNSRTGSRAGSRLGSRVGSPTGSRNGSPPRYKGRTPSHTAPPMRVLPKGHEGEQALSDALARKLHQRLDTYGMSDNEDDMSDTSSVCSDRSATYNLRNGIKRVQSEDVVEILQMCQSNLWTERKEGLICLHSLINIQKEFSRLQLKKVLEIFNRMFADPHGKVFSMFLEMLPDFITNYTDNTHEWLYVLLTQLLKKMGADLLGSVQSKVLKALQIARETYPSQLQFNILSRYIIDQTQRPSLKVKVALLHYLLDLISMMQPAEITNTTDTRLALSRIITWTTEPKSQDVRKIAEAVIISIFELNAPIFTMMIRVLPKTFQDGAMKVLQGYKRTTDSTSSGTSESSGGQVMGRVAVAPGLNVVSPRGSIGTVDLMSPRGSEDYNRDSSMGHEELTENFRDITAGIQKLRMDSSADEIFADKNRIGKENKYNPNSYQDSIYGRDFLSQAVLDDDDDDSFNEELPIEAPESNIADLAFAFSSGKNRRKALDNLVVVLRSSDVLGGLAASQQQIQWDQHFGSILSGVLDTLRMGDNELRVASLFALKEMLRNLSNRFKSFAEVTVIHILESHKNASKEVSRAAEDCGSALCTLLPSSLCIKVLTPLTRSSSGDGIQACLKMLNNAINRSTPDELTDQVVAGLVPGLLQCYDNAESGIRKASVFCLVALHRVIGDASLCKHLSSLSGGKMKLLQLYIKRSQSNVVQTSGDV